ncbi:Tom37 C-terminal domain-containing protein [Trichophaea hybrida]|nr:Tom37 C-terminal domain-containing protein [Trichophaea hybrida]
MLELHVWGPGFGLPSIDPLCLSAIAYLNLTVPRSEWTLIPSSNPLLSPSKSLPALRDNHTWATGLQPIIEYLRQRFPNCDLDNMSTDREKASCTAFTALIQSRAQEIVDLSLYVSHKNFSAVTRPRFAKMLGWPVCYYLPLQARSAARERTRHLGFRSIDITQKQEEPALGETAGEKAAREATGPSPATKALKDSAANIKLAALCDDLLGALTKQLGQSRFLFGDDAPASVDCVAIGYLALLLIPEMPQSFAADAMRRFPRLCAYVHDLRPRFLGEEENQEALPWGTPERGDLPWLGGVFLESLKENLLGRGRQEEEWVDDDPLLEERKKRAAEKKRREWWKSVAFIAGGVFGMVGYVVWSGIVAFPGMHGEEVALVGEEEDEDEGEGHGNVNTEDDVDLDVEEHNE